MTSTPFPPTAEFSKELPTVTVAPCTCGLCRAKAADRVSESSQPMSDDARERSIQALAEDAELYKAIAAISDDPAYWCKQAFDATQERNALMAGRV